jgi:hypothetical protein
MNYDVDNDAMYFMQLAGSGWYRIPPQMVAAYLSAGACVKESGVATNWVPVMTAIERPFKQIKS